jgi:biotin transport system substrate-specific component
MHRVLTETFGPSQGAALAVKRVALVALGVAALAIAAKIKVPMWPVPITMQTFVVLTVGAAYGPALGVTTVLAYLAAGALGFDVFTNSGQGAAGLAYMLGGTGGYLIGYAMAAAALGALARSGYDRTWRTVGLGLLAGQALIFLPGVLWLGVLHGWDQPILAWGLWPFLPGEALKTALAALLLPLAWRAVGDARR